jgi:hypothetical protein
VWTAFISGVTGDVVAVERFVPTRDGNVELVMLSESGWNSATQTATASFTRTDGTSVTRVPAMPITSQLLPTATEIQGAMSEMNGRVVWTVEFNGVYFMTPLTQANSATDNSIQFVQAGRSGMGVDVINGLTDNRLANLALLAVDPFVGPLVGGVPVRFGNAEQPQVFTPTFVPTGGTEQARSLDANTRFITSTGATSLFPNAPAGQAVPAPTVFNDVVYILDGATLEFVQTVFVVSAFAQDLTPPVVLPGIQVADLVIPYTTWAASGWTGAFMTITGSVETDDEMEITVTGTALNAPGTFTSGDGAPIAFTLTPGTLTSGTFIVTVTNLTQNYTTQAAVTLEPTLMTLGTPVIVGNWVNTAAEIRVLTIDIPTTNVPNVPTNPTELAYSWSPLLFPGEAGEVEVEAELVSPTLWRVTITVEGTGITPGTSTLTLTPAPSVLGAVPTASVTVTF